MLDSRGVLIISLLIVVALVGLLSVSTSPRQFRMATTTSVNDTGLLDYLKPHFEESNLGATFTWVSVGTGQAIEIGKRGDADVVLVHNRDLEDQFIRDGFGVHGVTIAYNDFILVGPADDPAKVAGFKNITEAFRQVMQAGKQGRALFASRGDSSGTNLKELQIWSFLGIKPQGQPWYLEGGTGMSATLMLANEKNAYTLTDRGTWLVVRTNLKLVSLSEGDPVLLNLYRIIPLNPAKFPSVKSDIVEKFVLFLVSDTGQGLIRDYKRSGQSLFNPIFGKLSTLGIRNPYEDEQVKYWQQRLSGQSTPLESNAVNVDDPVSKNPILEGFIKALILIGTLDPEMLSIAALSLRVSGAAVLLGSAVGIPLGALIAIRRFVGKSLVLAVVNTMMAIPPVVVGLLVYLALSRSGPFGPLNLIFTPIAMIIAQLIIVIPICTGLCFSTVSMVDKRLREAVVSMGADHWQQISLILWESRLGLLAAIIVAFGRAISEVGAILMVGGNIRYFTRALTTAIVLETNVGEFDLAIALGIILLAMAFAINGMLSYFQLSPRGGPRRRILTWLKLEG